MQVAILLDKKWKDVARFFSQGVAPETKWFETVDEFKAFAKEVATLVTELVLAEVDVAQG